MKANKEEFNKFKEKLKEKIIHFVFTEEKIESMKKEKELPQEEREKNKKEATVSYIYGLLLTLTLFLGIFIR